MEKTVIVVDSDLRLEVQYAIIAKIIDCGKLGWNFSLYEG